MNFSKLPAFKFSFYKDPFNIRSYRFNIFFFQNQIQTIYDSLIINIYQPSPNKFMKCKYCGSRRVIKKGFRKNLTGKVREYLGIKKVPCEVLGIKD